MLQNVERWALGFLLGVVVTSAIAIGYHRAHPNTRGDKRPERKDVTNPLLQPKQKRSTLRLAEAGRLTVDIDTLDHPVV